MLGRRHKGATGADIPFSQGVPVMYKSWEMRNCDIRAKSGEKDSLEASQGRIYAFHRGSR